jgi:hypothetical protein
VFQVITFNTVRPALVTTSIKQLLKRGVQEEHKRETIREIMDLKEKEKKLHKKSFESKNVLDRFKKKE